MKTIRSTINERRMLRYKKKRQKHLIMATKYNEVKDVLQMLNKGCSPLKGIYLSRYPLDTAIKNRNVEVISILSQPGAYINKPIQSSACLPLHRAAFLRNMPISHKVHLVLNFVFRRKYFKTNEQKKIIKILEIFLNARMDVNMQLNLGDTPSYLSVKNQLRKLAKYLIERGAELNVCDFVKGHTLAYLLTKRQHKATLDKLPRQLALEHGLSLKHANFTDDCSRNMLHIIMEMCDSVQIKNSGTISECLIEKVIMLLLGKSDDNGNTPLHIAAEKKMFQCLLSMLDKFNDINVCNKHFKIMHVLLSLTNCKDDIEALIMKGIGMNKTNKDNMAAVQWATVNKNGEIAADFHERTISGESLFHLAILNNEQTFESEEEDRIIKVLGILLDAGLDVNVKTINDETPFYLAVKNKMRKVIEFLIEKGADINVCNRDGDSVPHYLIEEEFKLKSSKYDDGIPSDDKVFYKVQQNLDFIDWLLSKGLNVDLKNNYGQSPLQLAVKNNLLHVIPIFLKYANDVNFINEGKLTILHMILQSSYDDSSTFKFYTVTVDVKSIVESLLAKGVSVDIQDTFKNTALHIAAQQTRSDLMSILLKYATDVNISNDLGWTPLHFACESGNVEVVQKLIDHGADVNIVEDITGLTPLFIAVYNDHKEVIEVLAEAGADLNARDATGQTVLHLVDSMKSSMSAILRLGVDVDAKDNWGRVPLYYAMNRQDDAAIRQLLDFGANVSKNTLSNFVLRELLASNNVMGHHAKLMAAQLSIPKIYTTLVFRNYIFYYKKCLEEVKKMRACKIDDNTTLYNFLHMNPKQREAYESKERFQDVMSSLKKQFPHYCDIILAKRQEARNNRSLVLMAMYAWWKATNIFLPDICLAKIFQYVDRMTLTNLSAAPNTMKRSAIARLDLNPIKRLRLT